MAGRDSANRAEADFNILIGSAGDREVIPEIPEWEPPRRAAIVRDTKATILIRDDNSAGGGVYTQNFLLQNYYRSSDEQMQLILHTEGWNLIFYRSRPVIWSFSGLLYDEGRPESGRYLDWTNQFIDLYESRLKGTVAAGRYTVSVIFAGRLVRGFVYKLDLSAKVPFDTVSTFNMQMIGSADVTPIRDVPSASGSIEPEGGTATSKTTSEGTVPLEATQRSDRAFGDALAEGERVT